MSLITSIPTLVKAWLMLPRYIQLSTRFQSNQKRQVQITYFNFDLTTDTLRYTRLNGSKNRVISTYIHKQALSGYQYRYRISDKNAKKGKSHRIEPALLQQ